MACFLVPAAEAIVTAVIGKSFRKKEEKALALPMDSDGSTAPMEKIRFSDKLKWLTNLLCGGSALLAFEHVWHGEVVPWFPFLTAAGNPSDTAAMLHEMSTVGVGMALLVTAVWGCMLWVVNGMEKHALRAPGAGSAENGGKIL